MALRDFTLVRRFNAVIFLSLAEKAKKLKKFLWDFCVSRFCFLAFFIKAARILRNAKVKGERGI